MHLDKALPDPVSLFHDDFEWIQHIDYEHVPFRCRRCHAHGHLFRDFLLKNVPKNKEDEDKSEVYGFTKFTNHKRHNKKPSLAGKKPNPQSNAPTTSNSFEILLQPDLPNFNPSYPSDPSSKPSSSSSIPNIYATKPIHLDPQSKETMEF